MRKVGVVWLILLSMLLVGCGRSSQSEAIDLTNTKDNRIQVIHVSPCDNTQ
jgi:major membrane immunogen (membrane-anchored lipoprotein)